MSLTDNPSHTVAIIGGAVAGANLALKLAEAGALVVVFEQGKRPYGKIEDGLPKWHVALRQKEYASIDACLSHPRVVFVPNTCIGEHLSWQELQQLNFNAIVLACGAWRDRPLPIAEPLEGFGYQNNFIYWFNHQHEPGYQGPKFKAVDGAIVIGGGLASIDVAKALVFQCAIEKLEQRGIHTDVEEIEHDGFAKILERHQLQWADLNLRSSTLIYRKRLEDMPLTEAPPLDNPEKQQRAYEIRKRIITKATEKYCFNVEPLLTPVRLVSENNHVTGLECQRTFTGEHVTFKTSLVISSIGSIPKPIPGIPLKGELFDLSAFPQVFAVGNVATGKGNIVASRKHSLETASRILDYLATQPVMQTPQLNQLLERIHYQKGVA